MANITVTTNQQVIDVTTSGGVNVTNTTDTITVLPSGTLIIQGPDTYSINASTVAGGANLNLLNSNGTNDAVKIASGTNVTVSRTDADTISIASTDTNTTYAIASAATTGGANLNLVGSDSTTDSVAYKGAGATTVTSTDANTVTITSTDTNTTYTQNASATTGGANLNLVGSDSTTDSVKFASGTGITVSRTDADTITITNTVVGDVVGPASATDNALARFDTTTGKLIQNSNAILNDTGDLSIAGDLTVTGQEITTGSTSSINITRDTSLTSSILSPLTLRLTTTGTPAVGIGTSLAFETETAVGVNTQAGLIQLQSTNIGSGTENFNMNFILRSGGVDQERMYLTSAGNLVIDGDFTVIGNDIKSSTAATALTLSGSNVTVAGTLEVDGNQIKASDGTTALTLSASTGNVAVAGTLDVQGGTITESTGALSITTGAANGAITLAPNGTGNVALTLANGGNLTNSRNYVFGAIRNATTESNGDIWVLDADSGGAGTLPVRGVSIDNSSDTAKQAGAVVRNYSNTAAFSPRMVFERARGTSASPTTLSSGDTIGLISGTGYSSTLGWVNDTLPLVPAFASFTTSEAWVNNTNLGTQFNLSLAPSATTLTTAANLVSVIAANPQTFACRSDSYTWSNGKTGTTQRMALDVSGNLTVSAGITSTTGNITATAGNIVATAGSITANTNITATTGNITATAGNISTNTGSINANGAFDSNQALSATADLLNTNFAAGSSIGIQTNYWTSSAKTTRSVPQNTWKLGNFRFNSYSDTAGTFALGAQVFAEATENWTSSANGSRVVFLANKKLQSWTTGHQAVISAAPEESSIMSDTITLENSAGTDFAVLSANTAKFNVPVTTELTTTTISEGTTYTPAATVDNNISVQINTLSGGTTVIDLASLTGNTRGASYNILVFNNTASGTPIQVKNTRINTNNLTTHTITSGDRIIVNAYVVGDYATATHLVVA